MSVRAGGNVGVAAGRDVGIDADACGRAAAQALRFGGKLGDFGFGFDVEKENAGAQRIAHFFARFAHAGEDHAVRGNFCGENAREFAAADDIEITPLPGEHAQNAEIGIGLHGIANVVRQAGEGTVEAHVRLAEAARAIDVGGRADFSGDARDVHLLAVQAALAHGKVRRVLRWVGQLLWRGRAACGRVSQAGSLPHFQDEQRAVVTWIGIGRKGGDGFHQAIRDGG